MNSICMQESATASANGVFGELLQGVSGNNRSFLVTAPVDIHVKAFFVHDPTMQKIVVTNKEKTKSQTLADKIYEKYCLKTGGTISINTGFPIGKGLGSSSADLVALSRALAIAYTLQLTECDIEDLIRGIEPTDGVMYQEIVSYYHKEVKLRKTLGKLNGAMVIGVDEGGEIDTVEYNNVKRVYTEKDKENYDELYTKIEKAIISNDIHAVGQISSQSGILNQRFNPKKLLDRFLKIANHLNIPGVIVAHSGTYLGFLVDKKRSDLDYCVQRIKDYILDIGYQYEVFDM